MSVEVSDMSNVSKVFGAILLIIGTSIGGGMIPLPAVIAEGGFLYSALWFIVCWGAMTFAAFYILEVNLACPESSNMVSMAKATLGTFGQIITWFIYLFLLYTLVSAYVSGARDTLYNVSVKLFDHPNWIDTLLVVLIFATIIYSGIKIADRVNRGLMFTKFLIFLSLALSFFNYIDLELLLQGDISKVTGATTVIITSFGYAIIVPSIRTYLSSDTRMLKIAVGFGSVAPLVIYLLWCFIVSGVVPGTGSDGLVAVGNADNTIAELVRVISVYVNNKWLYLLITSFFGLCVFTSFLGVSLCLSDFLADGLHLVKTRKNQLLKTLITFLPPTLIALFYPKAYLLGIKFAGYWCIALLIILPGAMAWSRRYVVKMDSEFQFFGGKILIIVQMLLALLIFLATFQLF